MLKRVWATMGGGPELLGFTYFKCLRRALLDLYLHPIHKHIHDKNTKIMQGEVQNSKICEVYDLIRNKLFVLNIVPC